MISVYAMSDVTTEATPHVEEELEVINWNKATTSGKSENHEKNITLFDWRLLPLKINEARWNEYFLNQPPRVLRSQKVKLKNSTTTRRSPRSKKLNQCRFCSGQRGV